MFIVPIAVFASHLLVNNGIQGKVSKLVTKPAATPSASSVRARPTTPQVPVSDYVQQVVNLYYFPNPIVLAETLNSSGSYIDENGNPLASSQASQSSSSSATALPPLETALGNHIDALNALQRKNQAVIDAKASVQQTLTAERAAKRVELAANHAVEAMDPQVQAVRLTVERATTLYQEADDKVTNLKVAHPTPPATTETEGEKRTRLAELRRWQRLQVARHADYDQAVARQIEINYRYKLKVQTHIEAQEDLDRATRQRGAAETALSTAQTALSNAANNVSTQAMALREARAKAQLAAADRLSAFELDRQKLKLWRAVATPTSKDPVQRVEINVYPDSHSLFLRGASADVKVVREIIAKFDTPTPQARITLWTLELNLIGNKGRNALASKSMKIEQPITEARERMSLISACFRDSVAQQVSTVEALHPALAQSLDGGRLARSFFYDPEVAEDLGLNQGQVESYPNYYYFTRWTLPDPAAITTLGEAVIVYVLGTKSNRDAVDKIFIAKLANVCPKWKPSQFMHELGMSSGAGINAYQLEMTRALQRSALNRFIEQVPSIARIYANFQDLMPNTSVGYIRALGESNCFHDGKTNEPDSRPRVWCDNLFKNAQHPEVSPDKDSNDWKVLGQTKWTSDQAQRVSRDLGVTESMAYLAPSLLWLREAFGIDVQAYEDLVPDARALGEIELSQAPAGKSPDMAKRQAAAETIELAQDQFAVRAMRPFRAAYPTDQANARIAAADEMLKRIMIAFEDDLQTQFVLPALEQVKSSLNERAISVGKVDRISLIATNRYAARVEGNASAELDLAGQEHLVDQALMLGDLFTAAKGANASGILQKLKGFDQEPASEYYAVTSGADFKVTPIFDPTGQALHFQFDHVKNTNVLDSDGTNPALPRVDSHTASMMVQISNMELRELTRFETNTKLGLPEKRWGGIPFLNSIYPLSEIPIIGWFSRTAGRDAVSQTSVIYAQNAMYPTIGDLGNLLSSGFGVPPIVTGQRQ